MKPVFKNIEEEHRFNFEFIKMYNVKYGSIVIVDKYVEYVVTSINPHWGWISGVIRSRNVLLGKCYTESGQIKIREITSVDGVEVK